MADLKKLHFKEQQPDEEIVMVVRRHWFDILVQYVPVIIELLVLLAAAVAAPIIGPNVYELNRAFAWFLGSLLLAFIWMQAALIWVNYFLDVWILTNRRVVNVEQKGLFLREVSEVRYNKIQDVTTEVKGIIPTMLNYGEVYLQTAGKEARFFFHNVPAPYKIKAKLVEMQKRARRKDVSEIEKLLRGEDGAE